MVVSDAILKCTGGALFDNVNSIDAYKFTVISHYYYLIPLFAKLQFYKKIKSTFSTKYTENTL